MNRRQAEQHLDALYARAPRARGLFYQVRAIDPQKVAPPFARCYSFDAPEPGLDAAEQFNAAGRHVYVGVNPRFRPSGKNADVDGVVTLPLDYDSMELAREAGAKLRALGLHAGLVVLTGRGAHLYILLDRYEQRVDLAQDLGRRLCKHTGSDHVHDRARVMRMPGTVNWKPGVGGTMATLVRCEPARRYSLEEITAKLDAGGVPVPERGRPVTPRVPSRTNAAVLDLLLDEEETRRQEVLFSLVPGEYQRIAHAGVQRGKRSEAAMGLCRVLTNVGASEDEIEIFFRLRPHGIGEVVAEKGLAWLDRTLAALYRSESPVAAITASPLSTVRLNAVQKRLYSERADLWLTVDDGPFTGTSFKSGLALTARGADPWRFCLMAFGASPAPLGEIDALQALVGKRGRAVLDRDVLGLNVRWWWPKGRR